LPLIKLLNVLNFLADGEYPVNAIGLITTNMERTLEFYKILGLNFQKYSEGHYEATTESGFRLMVDSLDLIMQINPKHEHKVGTSLVLAHKVNSPREVDLIYDKLLEAGFYSVKPPWDAFWGQRYASVRDFEGNQVDLFECLDKD
jgi:uncharacterized glyoxalase superfamily protein PhnB